MKNVQIQNKIYYIYLIGFFLILTLPLLSYPPFFHPPTWAKVMCFKIIFSTMLVVFIYQIIFKKYDNSFFDNAKKLLNRKNKIFWPFWLLISFLGINLLATIFSLEPAFSFWASPYRSDGFLNYAFLTIFAVFIFLILKKKDWQKIWDFSILIGAFVAFVAIFQKFGLFQSVLSPYFYRPVSTIGGSIFLGIYLMLLTILSLSFGIIAKNKKRYFYFFCFILFLFVIMLTASRSASLGLLLGFLFFVFLFPMSREKNPNKKIIRAKILLGIILILGIFGSFWLRTQPNLVQKLMEDKTFGVSFKRIWTPIGRFSMQEMFTSRGNGWKVAIKGIKDRPLLGYGPENFSIAFDKYYDYTLSGIAKTPDDPTATGWWDKGHNFMIDIAVSAGIPALIIYLIFLGILFWQLQKMKNNKKTDSYGHPDVNKIHNENRNLTIIAHGVQATFISYFCALFFAFNTFTIYLISFLLISFSFFLISKNDIAKKQIIKDENTEEKTYYKKHPSWKYILMFVLFCLFICFIKEYNLKPLQINDGINKAIFLRNYGYCPEAIDQMEAILPIHSFTDNYLRLQYIDVISECINHHPELKLELSLKAIQLLDQGTKIRPYYTRNWQYLGIYINRYLDTAQEEKIEIETKVKDKLIKKAFNSFEKANQLSPGRPKIISDWARTYLVLENFKKTKEKADECIKKYPDFGSCYWVKALAQINLSEFEGAAESLKLSKENQYYGYIGVEDTSLIKKLIDIFSKIAKITNDVKYYGFLVDLYIQMIEYEPDNFQHHASLSFIYKILGEYDKAREEAMIVLEISPESKQIVEEFLKTLP